MTAQPAAMVDSKVLDRKLLGSFVGALAVVLALALAVLFSALRASDASRLVAHTHEVLEALVGVDAALVRVESAARGYAITGDAIYLSHRDNALSGLESGNQRLGRLVADHPEQLERWKTLSRRIDEQVAQYGRVVVVRQSDGAEVARKLLDTGALSHDAIREIRTVFYNMEQVEHQLLTERLQSEKVLQYGTVIGGSLLAAVFIVLFTLSYLAIRRSLAARHAAEIRVLALNQELRDSNKELESFSYSVSHDLRSPLRAMDGFSRILEEDYASKLDDEGRRLLGIVRDNSRKMGELIDDLLEFSRLGRKPISTAEINMRRLVEEVLGEIQAPDGKVAGFVVEALPPARGDAILLKQAWVNLLGNAIKFSSKREQPVIEVSGHVNGAEQVYCVKDNGAGFDMRYYDKLFGVFQRLHRSEEFDGTGVGLAIVQRVVARHGGRVWAEGRVGEGAAFYFSLPKGGADGRI